MEVFNYGTSLRKSKYVDAALHYAGLNPQHPLILETQLFADEPVNGLIESGSNVDFTSVDIRTEIGMRSAVTYANIYGGTPARLSDLSGNAIKNHLGLVKEMESRIDVKDIKYFTSGFVRGHRVYLSESNGTYSIKTKHRVPGLYFPNGLKIRGKQIFDFDIITEINGICNVRLTDPAGNPLNFSFMPGIEPISTHYNAVQSIIHELVFDNPSADVEEAKEPLKDEFGQREHWDSRVEELLKGAKEISDIILSNSSFTDEIESIVLTGDLAAKYLTIPKDISLLLITKDSEALHPFQYQEYDIDPLDWPFPDRKAMTEGLLNRLGIVPEILHLSKGSRGSRGQLEKAERPSNAVFTDYHVYLRLISIPNKALQSSEQMEEFLKGSFTPEDYVKAFSSGIVFDKAKGAFTNIPGEFPTIAKKMREIVKYAERNNWEGWEYKLFTDIMDIDF